MKYIVFVLFQIKYLSKTISESSHSVLFYTAGQFFCNWGFNNVKGEMCNIVDRRVSFPGHHAMDSLSHRPGSKTQNCSFKAYTNGKFVRTRKSFWNHKIYFCFVLFCLHFCLCARFKINEIQHVHL